MTSTHQQQKSTTKGQTTSLNMNKGGNSLVVQWSFTAKGLSTSSTIGQGNKILQALGHSQKEGKGLEQTVLCRGYACNPSHSAV